MSSHTAPGPLAFFPTSHTSCLVHHLHSQLGLLILFVPAGPDCRPREGRRWALGLPSGIWVRAGAKRTIPRAAPRRPPTAEGTRRAPTVRGAGVGFRMGGSESPSLAALLATREGWTPGAAAPGEPGGRVCASSAGPKPADSVALGLGWGGANTHQPRTSASWSGSSGPWRRPRPAALAAIATRAPSAA